MKDFVITCTTPCDMNQYYLRKHKMYFIGFYYYLDDEKFMDDFYTTHSVDEFFNKIKTCTAKTSQPDPEQYVALWSKLIEQGMMLKYMLLIQKLVRVELDCYLIKYMILNKKEMI